MQPSHTHLPAHRPPSPHSRPNRHNPGSPSRQVLALSLALLLLAGLLASVTRAEGVRLRLRVRAAPLRSEPSIVSGEEYGAVVYGQAFEELRRQGDWVRVRLEKRSPEEPGLLPPKQAEGWVHGTVLTHQELNGEQATATPWLVEGGKALEKTANETLKAHAKERRLDLETLDRCAARFPSLSELDLFMRQGRLGLYRTDWPAQAESESRGK